MKRSRTKSPDNRQPNQSWVRYRPKDSHEPKPSFEALWRAISAHDRATATETANEPIEVSFLKVQSAARAARQQYPHLDVQVLARGRDVFAVN